MTRSVGKIKDGDEWLVLFKDDGVEPVHADLFTELVNDEGIVRVSFAAVSQHGDGMKQADLVAIIRMKEDIAYALCRALRELHKV